MSEELKPSQGEEERCNHFMVWYNQGGYSYRRCSECDYIDGEKTFRYRDKQILDEVLEKIDNLRKFVENEIEYMKQKTGKPQFGKRVCLRQIIETKQEIEEMKEEENNYYG